MKKLLNIPDNLYKELKEEAWGKRMNLAGYIIQVLLSRKGLSPIDQLKVTGEYVAPRYIDIKKEDISTGIEIKEEAIEEALKSKWPTTKFGKPLSGKQERCTNCFEMCPIEFAQEHYMKEHGDV